MDNTQTAPMASLPDASALASEHESADRDQTDGATSATPSADPAETGAGSASALTAIFHHLRELFTFYDSCDSTLCLLLKDWTTDAISALVVSPPPDFTFAPNKYIYSEPLETGELLFCIRVPQDYPGGKRGFFNIFQAFLRRHHTFGIRAVYLRETAIENFLSTLNQDFKAKAKASGKKGKGPKGKRLKWKNPFAAFGCNIVWAYDLSCPEKLYLRIRYVDKDASALVVVDTNDDEYKSYLSSDKTKFINITVLQISIQLLILWWQNHFREMAAQNLGSHTEARPEDQWWWSVIQGHQEQAGTESHGHLTAEDTHGELLTEEMPKEVMTDETPEDLTVGQPEELISPTDGVHTGENLPPVSDVPEAKIDDSHDLHGPEPPELPVTDALSSQTQKAKKKKKKSKNKSKNKKKKAHRTAEPGQVESDNTPVTMPQEVSTFISSIPIHESPTTPRAPSADTVAQSPTGSQHQAASTSSVSQSAPTVEIPDASPSLDSSQDHMSSTTPAHHLPPNIATSQPYDGITGHNVASVLTPVQPASEETLQATEATRANNSITSTIEESTVTLVGYGPTLDEPSHGTSLSHEHASVEDSQKAAEAVATSAQTSFVKSVLEDTPAPSSNLTTNIEEPSDFESKGRSHSYDHPYRPHTEVSSVSETELCAIPGPDSESHPKRDVNESEGHEQLQIEKHGSSSRSVQPSEPTFSSENITSTAQSNSKKAKKKEKKKNKKKNRRLSTLKSPAAQRSSTTDTPRTKTEDNNATSAETEATRIGSHHGTSTQEHSTQPPESETHSATNSHPEVSSNPNTFLSQTDPQSANGQVEWNVVSRTRRTQPSLALTTTKQTQPGHISSATANTRPSQKKSQQTPSSSHASSKTARQEISNSTNTSQKQKGGTTSKSTSQPQKTSETTTTYSLPPFTMADVDFPPLPSEKKVQEIRSAVTTTSTTSEWDEISMSEESAPAEEELSATTSSGSTADMPSCKTETTVRSVQGDDDHQTRLERDAAKPSPAVASAARNDNDNAATPEPEPEPERALQRETTSHQPHGRGTHPSPSHAPSSSQPGQRQRPANWFWQLDSHGFPCALAGCDKRCSSWDGASVICPRCGPYSEVRYCGEDHLFADIKAHWARTCGQMTFRHPCRESTIPRQQRDGPPLLPSRHNWDAPERHRQAIRHAVDRSGDYFIFSDWEDWRAAGQPENILDVRCSNRVVCVVSFDDREDKDRFRRVLGVCLFASIEVVQLVGFLFRMIRDNLVVRGVWNDELDAALRYQMKHELAVSLLPMTTGTRHACQTDWDGRSRRACPDPVCQAEYVPLLGEASGGMGMGRGSGGFRRLCDYFEANFWLLRAARITHPQVAQVAARTRGEGFDEVLPEDRRLFRRGEGWDGAGTGPMEIEGPQF